MLDVDSSRNQTTQITNQHFKWWRVPVWIICYHRQQLLYFLPELCPLDLLRIFSGLAGKNDLKVQRSISLLQFSKDSSIPSFRDSLIPGMLSKWRVS